MHPAPSWAKMGPAMGVGHMGLAFASKRVVPKMSLGILLTAGFFLDVVWAVALSVGLEHARIVPGITRASPLDLYDYPISHSLVAALLWASLWGILCLVFARDRLGALVLAVGVASHWLLDVASHRPDVPVLPSGPYIGLGLWQSVPGTLAVEGLLLLGGVAIYVRSTRGDRFGHFGLLALVAFALIALGVSYLGPPPPNMSAVVTGTALLGLPVVAAHFVDRHRQPLEKAR